MRLLLAPVLAVIAAAVACGAGSSEVARAPSSQLGLADAGACAPTACGPRMGAPNFLCDDGGVGGPGPCERKADGGCGWVYVSCTPASPH